MCLTFLHFKTAANANMNLTRLKFEADSLLQWMNDKLRNLLTKWKLQTHSVAVFMTQSDDQTHSVAVFMTQSDD